MQLAIQRTEYAATQLRALASEVEAYLKSVKSETVCTISDDRRGYKVESLLDQPIPASWNFTVSEIIHHLRSALDNTVWYLACLDQQPSNPRDISFPVVFQEEKWERAVQTKLAGIPLMAISPIRSVQPFKDFTERKSSWLRLLQHLSNQDKHSELLQANVFISAMQHQANIDYREQPTEPESIESMHLSSDRIAAFIKTGGYILNVRGSFEAEVHLVLIGPDGSPYNLITCLAKLTASVGEMIEALYTLAGIDINQDRE
jgi:hypothetical protein